MTQSPDQILLTIFGALLFFFLFSKFTYLNSQENSDARQHCLEEGTSMSESDWRVEMSLCTLLQFKQISQTEHWDNMFTVYC